MQAAVPMLEMAMPETTALPSLEVPETTALKYNQDSRNGVLHPMDGAIRMIASGLCTLDRQFRVGEAKLVHDAYIMATKHSRS